LIKLLAQAKALVNISPWCTVSHQSVIIDTNLLLLFAVLVGLYEEPEKPNNALEYP